MSDAIGSFEDIVALAPQHGAVLSALRALVLSLDPQAVEVSRPGDRAVSWGTGPRKMSEAYAYAQPHAKHVNLGFYRGAELPDPGGRLEGAGKLLRHIKVRTADDLAHPALCDLLVAAIAERRAAVSG